MYIHAFLVLLTYYQSISMIVSKLFKPGKLELKGQRMAHLESHVSFLEIKRSLMFAVQFN